MLRAYASLGAHAKAELCLEGKFAPQTARNSILLNAGVEMRSVSKAPLLGRAGRCALWARLM